MSAVAPCFCISLFHHNLRPFLHYTVSDLRNQLIDRIDVLNKVKELFLIPKLEMIPMRQIAQYYDTTVYTIRNVYQRHREEINSDGVRMIKSSDFLH